MQKQSKKRTVIAVAILVLVGFAALVTHNYKNKTSEKYNDQAAAVEAPKQHEQDSVNAAVNADAAALDGKPAIPRMYNVVFVQSSL